MLCQNKIFLNLGSYVRRTTIAFPDENITQSRRSTIKILRSDLIFARGSCVDLKDLK